MAKIIQLPNAEKILGQLNNEDKGIILLGLKMTLEQLPKTIKARSMEKWNTGTEDYRLETIADMKNDLKRTHELIITMSKLKGFDKTLQRFKINSDKEYFNAE